MIHQVQITTIEKLDLYEGSIQFSISENEYQAFYYNDKFEIGELVEVEFDQQGYPLEWDVIFSENKDKVQKLEKSNDSEWSYYAYGKIISINPVKANFGDIELELGNWTNDPKVVNEFIYWKIERLDIFKVK